ncbi:lysoplasmalogenase-like protein TMEM86A [Patella vulgata]|uniref:lysoplasmalogenase n=1 Tax=Patella caerulea TaxID=87958 RepID=A0AAN8QF85_PATCE|nr:lysoplasmalogenase-like protein TMEM86A [Patella vulgata]
MTKPLSVLKSVGPKLVPFFKTVSIFFVLFGEESHPSIFYCIVKCLPIISLILFVLLHGMSLNEYYRYARHILIGLFFSALGDAFLVYKKQYFELGILMFAIAQIYYSRAFGWRPFNPYAGTVFLVLGCIVYSYIKDGIKDVVLSYIVGLYVALISTMAWRSVARVQFFDDLWTWTKLCGCAGAILFMISDLTIAIDKFVTPVPFSHVIIMSTYYAAQVGISLSVVDSQVDELLKKKV